MYKVLIVDDEVLVRIGIKSYIQWDELGLVLIGEASNGIEALKIIEEEYPEIILLDIKMPEMDGIELLRILNKRKIFARVIVLSCHDDYEYVREALKLGAMDYILKLSLKPDELKKLLLKTVDSILDSPSKNESYGEDLLGMYIKQILTNSACSSLDFFHSRQISDFNARINGSKNISCMIRLPHGEGRKQDAAYNVVKEVVKEYDQSICLNYTDDEILVIFSDVAGTEEIGDLLRRTIALIKSYLDSKAQAGLSNVFSGTENIADSFRQCTDSLEYLFYYNNMDIISYTDCKSVFEKNSLSSRRFMENLSKYIELCDEENTVKTIDSLFEEIICGRNVSPHAVKVCIIEVINLFSTGLRLYSLSFPDMGILSPYAEISNQSNIYQLKEYILHFIREFFHFLNVFNKTQIRDEINIAKNFIIENYYKDINLGMVARTINISENYFSTIFKKETGLSFIDYLNKIRIQKARDLILGDKVKASKVAYMVGYNSISYFSKTFKKLTGQNPSDLSGIK